MRKSIAAATMAASLTIGGAAGVALFTPSLSGATATAVQVDDEGPEHDRPDVGERLAEVLAPLVDDEVITQAQADAVIDAIVDARPDDRPGRHGRAHGRIAAVVEDLTGLNHGQIRAAFVQGTTLRELLEEHGSSGEEFVDAVLSELEEHLDRAVENGRLTPEEAEEKLAQAEVRANEALDAERPVHPGPRGDAGDEGDEG